MNYTVANSENYSMACDESSKNYVSRISIEKKNDNFFKPIRERYKTPLPPRTPRVLYEFFFIISSSTSHQTLNIMYKYKTSIGTFNLIKRVKSVNYKIANIKWG